ncbi:hypothetical protein ACFYWU_42095 [Streptomyces chrestomyceticus]|uniref:hypothetical protein n=1 Tax=Streptomyces chrestomyceticus TaxID=68185 RepID=UPI003673F81E
MGASWELAREHVRRELGCPRGRTAGLVERLAAHRGLEPCQVLQADGDELLELDAGAAGPGALGGQHLTPPRKPPIRRRGR